MLILPSLQVHILEAEISSVVLSADVIEELSSDLIQILYVHHTCLPEVFQSQIFRASTDLRVNERGSYEHGS